ncbi:MAG: LysE/ArgO family amino acid transporter [Paracoccaceae bacterium]|jgi:L-lysine exporter family protein LysE/ArgO
MVSAALAGYLVSLSLILAIGAQNAFVLRQGLRREFVFPVVLICALSDASLIALGIAGLSSVLQLWPPMQMVMLWGGALFLITYGALRFRSAYRGGQALVAANSAPATLGKVIATCLLFTWANPHVYVDTVGLIGSIAAQYAPDQFAFGIGATLGSFSFFAALGYGARFLAPLFAKPKSWVMLEFGIGTVMWIIAAGLIFEGLGL